MKLRYDQDEYGRWSVCLTELGAWVGHLGNLIAWGRDKEEALANLYSKTSVRLEACQNAVAFLEKELPE
jgi:hypothetical protein